MSTYELKHDAAAAGEAHTTDKVRRASQHVDDDRNIRQGAQLMVLAGGFGAFAGGRTGQVIVAAARTAVLLGFGAAAIAGLLSVS